MKRREREMSLQTFETTILPLQDKLFRFSLRIVKDRQEAEDVVQDVLIKVWNKRDEWINWMNMEAMCMTITRNLSIDRTRSKHNQTYEIPEGFDIVSDREDPGQRAERRDVMANIQTLIKRLPENQQMVIQLRDIEGYSYKEIAEILGITMNQVKINLYRARIFLKEHIRTVINYEK